VLHRMKKFKNIPEKSKSYGYLTNGVAFGEVGIIFFMYSFIKIFKDYLNAQGWEVIYG
jgi:hypothetical protein